MKLFLLGTPYLLSDDEVLVKLKRRKSFALLSFLAIKNQPISRDVVATLLWGDYDQERARAELRVAIHDIKKTVGENALLVNRDIVQLNPDFPLWIDALNFQGTIHEVLKHHPEHRICAECLERCIVAYELYQGEFLSGFYIADSLEFESWLTSERQNFQQLYIQTSKKIIIGVCAIKQFERAISYAQRWIDSDPFDEDAYRHLMLVYAWSGNNASVSQVYSACEEFLANEIGIEPSEETTALYEDILSGKVLELPKLQSKPSMPRHNLPPLPRPFRGRKKETQQLISRLQDKDCRLLTICGLGGVGKTYLAVHTARQMLNNFADGVFFVPLSGTFTFYAILTHIAESIGLQFEKETDLELQLFNYLSGKNLLLILDNFEHLLEHTHFIELLLDRVNAVNVLVTSRLPLKLKYEYVFTLEEMREGGVELFIDSATRANASYSPKSTDMRIIEQICEQLAGHPLAIELAATWVRVLTLPDILTEIQHNVSSLMTEWIDAPQRHLSLQNMFDYSWNLLAPDQRTALARLSIFPTDFNFETAKKITNISASDLASLAAQQLVKRNSDKRYTIHMLVRQFAFDKLQQNAELWSKTVVQYVKYWAQFLLERYSMLISEGLPQAQYEIAQELDAIRYACALVVEHKLSRLFVDALPALAMFFQHQEWHEEGISILEYLVQHVKGDHLFIQRANIYQGALLAYSGKFSEAHSMLLHVRSQIQYSPSDLAFCDLCLAYINAHQDSEKATEYALQALNIYEELNDSFGSGRSLYLLSEVAMGRYGANEAIEYAQKALVALKPLGQCSQAGNVNRALARMYLYQGELEKALISAEKSLEIFSHLGLQEPKLKAVVMVATILNRINQYEKSEYLLQDVIDEARERQFDELLMYALMEYGTTKWALKDYPASVEAIEQALTLSRSLGMTDFELYLKVNLADTLVDMGEGERAIHLITSSLDAIVNQLKDNLFLNIARRILGKAYIQLLQYSQAQEILYECIRESYNQNMVLIWLGAAFELGRIHYALGSYQTAFCIFDAILKSQSVEGNEQAESEQYVEQILGSLNEEQKTQLLTLAKKFDLKEWLVQEGILSQ